MAALIWKAFVLVVFTHAIQAKTRFDKRSRDGCSYIFDQTGRPTGLSGLIGSGYEANVCEGNRLAVVHDRVHRIPLYVSILLDQSSINANNPPRYNRGFKPSDSVYRSEQASNEDYELSSLRVPCYERQSNPGRLYRDPFWLDNTNGNQQCTRSEPKTPIHRGHLIADSYVRRPASDKQYTYLYTNVVPQFQVFNNGAWKTAERQMYSWLQTHCGQYADTKAHLIVGAVPSSNKVSQVFGEGNVHPRYLGRWGFGNGVFASSVRYDGHIPNGPGDYRINMPAAMWTAACCIATDQNGRVHVRHTAFGRHARPVSGGSPVVKADWVTLMKRMLPNQDTRRVNLFPQQQACRIGSNYRPLTQ